MRPVKHIVKEGSREHVVYWDTRGTWCTEPRCEINARTRQLIKERARQRKEHLDRFLCDGIEIRTLKCQHGFPIDVECLECKA